MANVQASLEKDAQGVEEIRRLIKEFLNTHKGTHLVRGYLEEASTNEDLLLRFLCGRKYRSQHAWETLKRYAEVRFDEHPEVFPQKFSDQLYCLRDSSILGILQKRDNLGRRIMFMNGTDWEPSQYPMEILTVAIVIIVERLLQDEDALKNGIVYVQQCSGVGMKHAQQYSLRAVRRFVNIFWYAFPIKFKAIYYVNVPTVLSYAFSMIRPLLTKKLKERFHVIGTGKDANEIYENIPLSILPKFVGGTLDIHDAVDRSFLNLDQNEF